MEESRENDPDALIDKAQECQDADADAYRNALRSAFQPPYQSREAFRLLIKLPFRGYVTTNYDPLLSSVGDLRGYGYYSYPSLPVTLVEAADPPIFYVHGHVDAGKPPGSTLVLARNEFEEAYRDTIPFFLGPLLSFYPVLFIGASLREPAVLEVFRRVHSVHKRILRTYEGAQLPERCILLPYQFVDRDGTRVRNTEGEAEQQRLMDDLGVRIIRYEARTEDHSEIEDILRFAADLAGVRLTRQPSIGLGEYLPR